MPDLPRETIQQLALELDDVDVSAMVTIEDRDLVLVPPQPLGWGKHQLRLVQRTPDGNIREVGVWEMEIKKTAAFREADFQSDITLNGNVLVADHNLAEPKPESLHGDGQAQLQGALANGSWRTTGQMALLYNSNKQLMPRGENGPYVDLATFLLAYEQGPVVARVGEQTAVPDSLIAASFQRRGVSVGAQSRDSSLGMAAFSLSTEDVVGFVGGLGIGDSNNVTNGITGSARPLKTQPEALVLTATYLSGTNPSQSPSGGGVESTDTVTTQGDAVDVSVESQLLQRRLRMRGEYASTRFNPDVDSNLGTNSDYAYTALVTYTPWRNKLVHDQPLVWSFGLENHRIGTFFQSPANPTGMPDRAGTRAFTAINWSGLDAQLSIGQETDNVDDLDLVPRIKSDQLVASLAYTPQLTRQPEPDGRLPPLPWYGQPNFTASYVRVDQQVEKAGAGLPTGSLGESSNLSFGASFSYQTWNWAANYTTADTEDQSGSAPDTHSNIVGVNASLRFGEKLTLTPRIEYTRVNPRNAPPGSTATETATTTGGIGIVYLFTAHWSGSLQYDVNRQETACGCQDTRSTDVSGGVVWTQMVGSAAKPGIKYSLTGQYHKEADQTVAVDPPSSYQVFLNIQVTWAPSL